MFAAAVKKLLLMTLAGKGFLAESKDGACTININCFLFGMGEKGTKLQVAATEEISETSSHIKYFWLLFIPIPYGSYNTTAITSTETINDKLFYASFFKEVQANLSDAALK
ncbi:MAG TPA: hypothetical protein VGK27_10715 [Candidatus Deferrimicrobiaceae bacterium]